MENVLHLVPTIKYKITVLSALLLCPVVSMSQSAVRFVDAESKQPLCGIYANIYKNTDTFEDCGCSDDNGFKSTSIRQLDSNAKYYLSYSDNIKYQSIWKEIDPNNKDTITIYFKKSGYYIPPSPDLLSEGCAHYSLSDYYPREPRNLDDLPNEIATKVTDYLTSRVGINNFKKFRLIGGQIVNIDEYKKRNPEYNPKTAYYLCYSYRNLASGISMYASNIELDEKGNILKDIGFPIIKPNTIQENIIPLKTIINKAITMKFYEKKKTEITMSYYVKSNILVWKLINESYNDDYTFLHEELIFNAHNGVFIKKKSHRGLWVD